MNVLEENMVGRLFVAGFWCCLSLSTQCKDILIVADEWPQMEILEKYLVSAGGLSVTKVEQNEFPEELSNFYACISFIHRAMEPQIAMALIEYTRAGGRMMVLHHGISSAKRKVPEWMDFLGMSLPTQDEDPDHFYYWRQGVSFHLVNLQPNHYITSHQVEYPARIHYRSSDTPSMEVEYPAFELTGTEVFVNHAFKDGREKTVLFGFLFQHPETGQVYMQDRSGWYKPYGQGWVFYFQPGHANHDMTDRYMRILLNALEWKP